MKRRKNGIRNTVIVSIFIITILLTNIQIFTNFNFEDANNRIEFPDTYQDLQLSDDPYLSDKYKTGSGDNQDMRLYVKNSSSSLNNEEDFQIEAMSTTDTCYLAEGNFTFEFQNNYTTDYVIEDTHPLDARDFIDFPLQKSYSSVVNETGTALSTIDMDELTGSSGIIIDAVNRVVSVNVSVNYTGRSYAQSSLGIDVDFDREEILGFLLSLGHSVSEDAYLTIKIYDITNSIWRNVTTQMFVNSSFGLHTLEQNIVNENLNNIDLSNTAYIQLYYYGVSPTQYNVTINQFKLPATYAFDLPINDQEYVALEFDLKGKSTTVNGFYAWIRIINQTAALNSQLEISLYKANDTIIRSESQKSVSLNKILEPDVLIDSITVKSNEFNPDTLNYFAFNTANTNGLSLYNYLIVIKSNNSYTAYSLVALPQSTFGDPDEAIDHQLLATTNDGSNWDSTSISVPTSYTSETLDAALFKVEVTRGHMPSDFTNSEDEEDTLRIQDLPIEDLEINSFPYNDSSSLKWGIGQWHHNFTTPIIDNVSNDFVVDLTWNKSIIGGFQFNVTYNARAYWIDPASSYYNTSYTSDPEWQLNYTLSLTDSNFDDWNFFEMWFVYPDYYTAHNLTNPDFDDVFELAINETNGELQLDENESYKRFILNENVTKSISGDYSLQLTSWNFLSQTDSFIHFNHMGVEALWETHGFMYGDDISVGLGVKGPNQYVPNSGDAEVKLFYPDTGNEVPGATLVNTTNGFQSDSILYYDFNNATIYSVDETIPVLGNYYLAYFWNNGSAIGAKTLKLYIDDYDVALNSLFYDEVEDENILTGFVDKVFENYSILIGSVNISTAEYNPSFYAVNQSNLDIEYIYEVGGYDIPISLNSFLQNETILNPDEDINVKLQLQNNFEFSDVKVQVKVQLVALANDEWIIDQQSSSIKTLNVKGDSLGRDIQDFSLNLTIPTLPSNQEWYGYNSPIRRGGVKTKVIVSIDFDNKLHEIGMYDSDDYALLVNDTQNDFEGYLIELKYNNQKTGETIVKPFQRDECNYLPEQSTFVINLFDQNYVSSYEQFIYSFGLKLNSKFSDITINPSIPIRGEEFNITSKLTTEFGAILTGKNVTLQYYDIDEWKNVSSRISDLSAQTNFLIDTLDLNDEDQLTFRLSWQGEAFINQKSQNITIDLYRAINELSASLQQNTLQIYKDQKSTIKIILTNTGNSELTITSSNISFSVTPNLSVSIVQIDYVKLNQFKPGESTEIIIEVTVSAIDEFDLTVFINALNVITSEDISIQISRNFLVYDTPLASILNSFFTIIIIGSILIAWAIIFLEVRRLIRKIETPIEEPKPKKSRKGRYVKVGELEEIPKPQEEEPPKKITKKKKKLKKKRGKKSKEEPKKEQEKSTDFDSLLEEEGLSDNK